MLTQREFDKYRRVNCDGEPYLDYEGYWQDMETKETLNLIKTGIENKIQGIKNRVELQKLIRTVFKNKKEEGNELT